MAADSWELIHAERTALADDLADITEEQWATRSWCADWSVHQALAHILATTTMTPVRFLSRFAAAGFNFTRFNARNVAGGRVVRAAQGAPPNRRTTLGSTGDRLISAVAVREFAVTGTYTDAEIGVGDRLVTAGEADDDGAASFDRGFRRGFGGTVRTLVGNATRSRDSPTANGDETRGGSSPPWGDCYRRPVIQRPPRRCGCFPAVRV